MSQCGRKTADKYPQPCSLFRSHLSGRLIQCPAPHIDHNVVMSKLRPHPSSLIRWWRSGMHAEIAVAEAAEAAEQAWLRERQLLAG
jgi:hypothetical protein